MERVEKTVFISYRRTNVPWALAIFQNLTQFGYDVFFDFSGYQQRANNPAGPGSACGSVLAVATRIKVLPNAHQKASRYR